MIYLRQLLARIMAIKLDTNQFLICGGLCLCNGLQLRSDLLEALLELVLLDEGNVALTKFLSMSEGIAISRE